MGTSMNALVYDRQLDPWEDSRGLRQVSVDEPVLDERKDFRDAHMALIRPRYAGFCGSDRGIWFRNSFRDMIYGSLDQEKRERRVIGHELFGEIVALGSEAKREFGFAPGDAVSTESHVICGECYQCRIGDTHVCETNRIIGISTDGCFADLVKLPANILWPVNTQNIRPEVGALLEPFGNAVHACTKVNLRGKRVAILGCGTIGLFAVAVAKALGAHTVIGVEPLPSHVEMARKLGCDEVLVPANREGNVFEHDPELTARIKELTDGVGVDVALEMSGINASVNNAISSVRRGGQVILFGLKSGDAIIQDFDRVIVDGISLHSVVGRRVWETWHIGRSLLEARNSKLHDQIWEIILNRGENTVVDFSDFEAGRFETSIRTYPKVIFKF